MGDDRNILWSQIVASAEANDITPAEAVLNMQAMAEQQGTLRQREKWRRSCALEARVGVAVSAHEPGLHR